MVLRELLRLVNRLIEKSESIRSLKIESVSITLELMKEIVVGLTNSEYLKELYITKCNIGD